MIKTIALAAVLGLGTATTALAADTQEPVRYELRRVQTPRAVRYVPVRVYEPAQIEAPYALTGQPERKAREVRSHRIAPRPLNWHGTRY